MRELKPQPYLLKPGLQNYDWGDTHFIPTLLGQESSNTPVAEAWFGAHPALPSRIVLNGAELPLNELAAEQATSLLGERSLARFAAFPFLLKILSAARPLSIQVHPSKTQAEGGFAARSASYKDANHKPELLVALTPFYGLCGFRPFSELTVTLAALPELVALLPKLEPSAASLRGFVAAYYGLAAEPRTAALLAWLRRISDSAPQSKSSVEYWLLEAHQHFSPPQGADVGLFFFALLNFVVLARGQGLYLPAGVLHAYLNGSGVEVMASSDNVLRGGLTSKPVDVAGLLHVTRFEAGKAWVVEATEESASPAASVIERNYPTAANEFALSFLDFKAADARSSEHAETALHSDGDGPSVLLVLDAQRPVTVRAEGGDAAVHPLQLGKGQSCLLPHGTRYSLSTEARARVVRVTVKELRAPYFRGRAPVELSFGTSGLRGLVSDISDLEAYVATRGFLDWLVESGEALRGASLALGGDLRPSTDSKERSIARAVAKAAEDAGFVVIYCGKLPTPALMSFALPLGLASIMVTGSHIPFDRNGIKFNTPRGEVLKADEAPILRAIAELRHRLYAEPHACSLFLDDGSFKPGVARDLGAAVPDALEAYRARYLDVFAATALAGLRLAVYQHSAVGRDLLVELLRALGAEVHPFGRSETFVAIDTEAISAEQLEPLQREVDALQQQVGSLHAVVSTDGDSDRPLLLALDEQGRLRFLSGDRVGIVTADYLGVDAIAVAVSASDAIEQHFAPRSLQIVRTRIGSPHVIVALGQLRGSRRVAWESNGGFLLGDDIVPAGRVSDAQQRSLRQGNAVLRALPTRDALLPIVAVLASAKELSLAGRAALNVAAAFDALPARFSSAALLDQVAPALSAALQRRLLPQDPSVGEVAFEGERVLVQRDTVTLAAGALRRECEGIRQRLAQRFNADGGFSDIARINFLDGIRVYFSNGEIAHLRASGNAPQLRIYAVAASEARAVAIAVAATAARGVLSQLLQDAREDLRVETLRRNIASADQLAGQGTSAALIGCVAGSASAQHFWQQRLNVARPRLGAKSAVALFEDLPVNQAFGVLLAWQRLRSQGVAGGGALLAFVFGDGSRATPFTETDNGQKPALLSFACTAAQGSREYLPMVELALRQFLPVEAHLRRSGFDGLVIKWGDEVQVPSVDLSLPNPLFAGADVVRFVSVRELTAEDASNKDWVGVDTAGQLTAFIPRRPLDAMEQLADRGLLRREGGKLIGGINLGSIALSRVFLDLLLAEFHHEVNDASADRRERPDLDPQFFSALLIATIPGDAEREAAWANALEGVPALAALAESLHALLPRFRRVFARFEAQHGRPPKFVGMDFGDAYWGDIGQHPQIYEFYLSLLDRGPSGAIARGLAGLPEDWDDNGNLLVRSRVPASARIKNSVLIDCEIEDDCDVEGSVLLLTRARSLMARAAFDVGSTVQRLDLAPRAGSYRVVAAGEVSAQAGERLTSLFVDDNGLLLRVHEDTDLRDRPNNYDVKILGNALSFAEAHRLALALDPSELLRRRLLREQVVWALHPR